MMAERSRPPALKTFVVEHSALTEEIFVGLVVGEGSFHFRQGVPCLSIKMHTRHAQLLMSVYREFGGTLNGPYVYGIRTSMIWTVRGKALGRLIPMFDRLLTDDLCPHVAARYRRVREAVLHRETPEIPGLRVVRS